MTPETTPDAPILYEVEGDTYIHGNFQRWLRLVETQLMGWLEVRQEANHTAKATRHTGTLWLTEAAYTQALKNMQTKVEDLTAEMAAEALLPGVIITLSEKLQMRGLALKDARVDEKPYAEVKEGPQRMHFIPSSIVPKGTSICRRLTFTIQPLAAPRLVEQQV